MKLNYPICTYCKQIMDSIVICPECGTKACLHCFYGNTNCAICPNMECLFGSDNIIVCKNIKE